MSICVVVPCHSGDQNQAHRLLKWVAEMGRVNAQCILVCANDCDISALLEAGQQAFTACTHMLDAENVKCNWSSDDPGSRDPSGPNSIFRQVAWHIYLSVKQPWLFLEADSIPLCRDWYEVLSAEYKACGKVVMGDLIKTNSPHLSGVAVYPPNVPELFPEIVHNVQGAFDMSKKVLEKAHVTRRIQDNWRAPTFTAELFSKIRSEAVIFHANKDGSLIPFLRAKLGMKGGEAVCTAQPMEHGTKYHVPAATPLNRSGSNGAATFNPESAPFVGFGDVSMADEAAKNIIVGRLVKAEPSWPAPAPVVDIYLKTWHRDHELAGLCLKSIDRFVTGYRKVIVQTNDREDFDKYIEDHPTHHLEVHYSLDRKPGYLDQQKKKLESYKLSDAQYFLWVDSDCCFNRPVDVSEFFANGKSKWRFTQLNLARPDQSSTWVPVMRKFLGIEPTEEYMREHPTMVPRWLMEEMEKFCLYKHGVSLGDYIMSQSTGWETDLVFSEINCAGFFARTFYRDKFEWVPDDQANPCLVQGFTWAGPERIAEDIARAKEILGESEPPIQELEKASFEHVMVFGVEQAMELLATEAARSPGHKGGIVRKFNAAMSAVKPKMPEGFGKGRKKAERKTNAIVSAVA